MYGTLKKKYSQNFLIDSNILLKISNLIPKKNFKILEIGPGDGRLTDYILEYNPSKLLIIEIDKDLIPILKSKYENIDIIKIINEDILNYQIEDMYDLIISNLPYKISSQILAKICLLNKIPKYLIFMFQKEFAERLLEKKLNSLNSLVNCFFDVKAIFKVSKNCFRPIPKVDSKVVLFQKKIKPLLNENELESFILLKRKLFSQKRKTLNNILKKQKLILGDFDLSLRPEDLELSNLIRIFRLINL